jgi:DnaJ like chaperone protein
VPVPPADPHRLQERFFETSFSVMGRLCKSDGRVSEVEIAFARSIMERMDLTPALRRAAILFFKEGKSPSFDLDAMLQELRRAGLGRGPLLKIFLEVQLGAAYADGEPSPEQREILERIRRVLQVPLATFRGLERLIQLQRRLAGGPAGPQGSAAGGAGRPGGRPRAAAPSPLSGAYATLGLEPQASDAEVKRAYRRLMSRHHPDKLMSRGAPDSALKMASQKTQEIRRAYETISRARAA